jgi:hypothetical protein
VDQDNRRNTLGQGGLQVGLFALAIKYFQRFGSFIWTQAGRQ